MKGLGVVVLGAILLTACGDDGPTASTAAAVYWAPVNGTSEVPANTSAGVGQAMFRLNAARTSMTFELVNFDINNVVQAHIHLAQVGVNGPIVQFLFGPVNAGGGASSGLLNEGVIDGTGFIGLLAGRPFSELIDHIEAGNAYVNIHTNDGNAATSGGPGDLPAGEIRGQIRLAE